MIKHKSQEKNKQIYYSKTKNNLQYYLNLTIRDSNEFIITGDMSIETFSR